MIKEDEEERQDFIDKKTESSTSDLGRISFNTNRMFEKIRLDQSLLQQTSSLIRRTYAHIGQIHLYIYIVFF